VDSPGHISSALAGRGPPGLRAGRVRGILPPEP